MKKNLFKSVTFMVALMISGGLFATNYIYNGSWSPSAPASPLGSGDAITILSGTYNSTGTFVIQSGAAVNIALGARWKINNTEKIVNKSTDFLVYGTILMRDTAQIINRDGGVIKVMGGGIVTVRDNSKVKNRINSYIDVEDNSNFVLREDSRFINQGTNSVFGRINLRDNSRYLNSGSLVGTGNVRIAATISFNNNSGSGGYVNQCTGSTCISNVGNNLLGVPLGAPSSMTAYYYPGGSPPPVFCNSFFVIESDLTMGSDVQGGIVLVQPGATLTIPDGISLTICYSIINDGAIVVESGGALVQLPLNDNNKTYNGDYFVEQEGHASTLAYNIWSSPIQFADLVTTFPSSNPCDMYVVNGSTQQWRYDFPILQPIYTCNGNTGVEFTASDVYTDGTPDGIMDLARGYFITGNDTAIAKSFTGSAVNNGDVSINVYTSAVIAPGFDLASLNLIGNPYPSGLDALDFWNGNTSLSDGLYFYDDVAGDYAYWNTSGGVPASGGILTPNGTIGVAQGLFSVAASNSTVDFTNAMRSTTNDQFFKMENSDNHNVWMNFAAPSASNANILVGFNNEATDDFDFRYDAHLMTANTQIKFASVLNNENFVIQSIAPLAYGTSKSIPLLVNTTESGIHTFSEFNRENIGSSINVFLKDNSDGSTHDLKSSDYEVSLIANEDYTNRFELVFENIASEDNDVNASKGTNGSGNDVATGINDDLKSNFALLSIEGGNYTLTNASGINGDIQVIDVTGKVVWTANNVQSNSVNINLNGLSSGMYLINVMNNNENVYSNKLIK